MNYRLTVNIFSQQMGTIPLPVTVQIPENLAYLLMHLTVRQVKLTIDENPAPTSIPLLNYDTGGAKPETDRPELKKLFPDGGTKPGKDQPKLFPGKSA